MVVNTVSKHFLTWMKHLIYLVSHALLCKKAVIKSKEV